MKTKLPRDTASVLVGVRMTPGMRQTLEDYQRQHGFPTLSYAIRELLQGQIKTKK